MSSSQPIVSLASSANGRVSGKSWKEPKTATVRSHLPEVIKTKNWEHRMEKEKKARAIKMLQAELKDEKQADMQRRREITRERKRAADERRRVEEEKTKLGARKAARLRRKMGRTKKVHH